MHWFTLSFVVKLLNCPKTLERAFEYSGFNTNLGSWDTQALTSLYAALSTCPFNQNIGGWNTGSVVIMHAPFYGNSAFNQDISNWDVSKCTVSKNMLLFSISNASNGAHMHCTFPLLVLCSTKDLSYMFYSATSFNQDLSSWNVASVKVSSLL